MINEKGIEVEILKPFPIIVETLGRIGIKSKHSKKMYPSCYIYDRNGKHYMVHFKEMLMAPDLSEEDYTRRNTIVWMLANWKLIKIVKECDMEAILTNMSPNLIAVLSTKMAKEEEWEICHKLNQFGLNQYKNLEEINEQ